MTDAVRAFRRWLGLRIASLASWIYPDAVMYDVCYATSPEQEPCILPLGHDGSHVPPSRRRRRSSFWTYRFGFSIVVAGYGISVGCLTDSIHPDYWPLRFFSWR